MRFGVLDQSPIPEGADASVALANTIDLARHAERLGFESFWVSEHHNSTGLAGAAPEILIGAIAAATERIRVGSGGVMLTHYAALKVAETFKVLAALYGDRIDLGVGRAPGSDQYTMFALSTSERLRPVDSYPDQVAELVAWLDDTIPPQSPFAGRVRAVPGATVAPIPVWLLASSPDSARFAAELGLPLAWAHFFGTMDGAPLVDDYRRSFRPSARHAEPTVSVTTTVICAETDDEAERLATSVQTWRNRGLSGPIPPPAASGTDVEPSGPLTVQGRERPAIIGNPQRCAAELVELGERFGADEVLAVTIVWDHAARVRSYELLAGALGL